ncbi:transcriptional repressor LexA [Bartonella sp. CB178]|uniref:transcriptional repressor LexA n=1 Tax=Bartonella sp. CB178 TaxID=3112255 RepID=UPI00300E5F3B
MLTCKQYELLLFIYNHIKKTGVSPSFDEMRTALELASKSGIHRLVTALEERGFIRRLPNRARAMEVVRFPGKIELNFSSTCKISPSITEIKEGKKNITIPVMGRIAAWVPISAILQKINTLSLPQCMIGSGEHYALQVKDNSMSEAGIFDKDTIIIKRQNVAISGEIIVAYIDKKEATLKRYQRKGASIALEAANPHYEARTYEPERVQIQGKLVGLIRKY